VRLEQATNTVCVKVKLEIEKPFKLNHGLEQDNRLASTFFNISNGIVLWCMGNTVKLRAFQIL
jgi:hypothetical protein